MSTLYVDPSIRDLGWAVFHGRSLEVAGVITPKRTGLDRLLDIAAGSPRAKCEGAVIEWPVARTTGKVRAQPEDLMLITAAAGVVVGVVSPWKVLGITPADWKGNLPKDVTHNHMWNVLSEVEIQIVRKAEKSIKPAKRHNLYDAICIGLYCEGRAPWKKPIKK